MPPKKEKKEQLTGDQACEMVLEYLIAQNRPYSAADVSTNLHNAVTKPTTIKVLKELHEAGEIEGRVAGKQIVYHAKQDPEKSVSEEELKVMDAEYETLREEIGALKAQFKSLQSSTSSLNPAPTLQQLLTTLHLMEEEIVELEESLQKLQTAGDVPLDLETIDREKKLLQQAKKAYLLRKKQFKELWEALAENYEGSKHELWESLGLDEVN